ncbi:hypothetical protein [Granulicatella adiacens]|uniref:hypothetical protein n=1 Tax=Granulicatella adiacens TaxID=46124 RepID=UPI003C6F319B
MKFITLTDATQETRTYTININNIACIETYVNDDEKLFTWIHGRGIEDGQVCVKETEEQILSALERQQTIEQILKNVVR